ncbi:hypothetical protein IFM89_013098 [Coptis chinensis]|uniref:Uncharacterized protein n=1 Tax=Coptis chinensis TaxID=261450 RepID=A0A835IMK1_9MAGN|nr:hypothetical protein IFM89_013098 [Coptis chinensis]
MPPKRATPSKAMMVNEGSASQAASKNEERRTRRLVSRLVKEVEEVRKEEISLQILLKKFKEMEKYNKALIAENKAVREENKKRAVEDLYEKGGAKSSSGTPVARKSHLEEVKKSYLKKLKSLLNGNKNSEFCGPLTSFDWNEAEPKRIGTSSIDTTCTIWDIERETVDTQLIAHDKEVYDIAWGGVGVFASVSADGSVRVFDLRDKEHSTIIYESSEPDTPLVRLGWNKQDPRYMATIIMDSAKVVVLDIRFPTLPVVELQRHQASVNAIAWAPHSSCHICTAGDDSQALIWDLSSMGQPVEGGLDPILAYTAGSEIEQLQWSSSQPDWVAIAFSSKLQILRV